MATKTLGSGILLKYDENGDTASHTTIGEIINITPNTISCEDVDVTTTDAAFMAFLPSEVDDNGEVTFEQVWHAGDTNHELVDTAFDNRDVAYTYEWQIVYPYATPVTDEFTAYVKSIGPASIDAKSVIKRTVVLKLTSAIART